MGRGPTMVYLKETIVWMCFYAEIEACVPVKLGCKPVVRFPVEEISQSLVKVVVRKHETTESS
jgi:hypothetical protein